MTFALLLATALNIVSLPQVEHLDCEVSTNAVLAISPDMSEIEFTLSIFSTSSNVVEVAFGTDTDLDGDISRKETELIVGCECSVWQIVDPKNGNKYIYGEASGDSEFKWNAWMAMNQDSKKINVWMNRQPIFAQLPSDMFVFKRSWTHFKIISRGKGQCFRSLNVNQSKGRFYIIVR